MNNETIAITDPSSGIGLDLARKYLDIGENVVFKVRNEEKLNDVVDVQEDIALMNRVREVEDILDAVMHLASATFITGVIMPADRGYFHART